MICPFMSRMLLRPTDGWAYFESVGCQGSECALWVKKGGAVLGREGCAHYMRALGVK